MPEAFSLKIICALGKNYEKKMSFFFALRGLPEFLYKALLRYFKN